jgi:tRNA 2-selenouridine synthase
MQLSPFAFFNWKNARTIIDIRSENDFLKGSFPQAISLPVNHTEPQDFFSVLLQKAFAHQVHIIDTDGRTATDANTHNLYFLEGGYNAYKRWRENVYAEGPSIGIIAGKTGSGKTECLRMLGQKCKQVIDLEALAAHKGSVFGEFNVEQPSLEQFHYNVLTAWLSLDVHRPVWMEEKGNLLGRLGIPEMLYKNMTTACLFELDNAFEARLQHIKEEYANVDKAWFSHCIRKLETRMGFSANHKALYYHETGQINKCLRILLQYYDNAYDDKRKSFLSKAVFKINTADFENADTIKKLEAQILSNA